MSRRVDDQMDHQMDDRTNGPVRDRAERPGEGPGGTRRALVVASVRHDAGEPIVGIEGLVRRIC